jgi:hypothetical protein
VQGGYGALFGVMVQVLLSIMCVAVQTISEQENCQVAGFELRADALVPVQQPL